MTATVLSHLSRQCLLCSCESSEVKDRLRRLIGECPQFCAICMPHCGRKGKCCVYSLAKVSIFFRRNRLSLQQKVRAFRIQSSEVENLRAFFPFFPCFSAEPPFLSARPLSFALCPSLRSRFVRPSHSLAPLAHACRHMRAYARTRALRTQRLSVFLPSPLPSIRLTFCDLWVKALSFPTSSPVKLEDIRHLHT